MIITNEIKDLIIDGEKVAENITVYNEKGKTIVSTHTDSLYFSAVQINNEKTENSCYSLDKKAVKLIKLTSVCDELDIKVEEDKLKIQGGSTIAHLPLVDSEKPTSIDFAGTEFSLFNISAVKNVLYAASQNENQHIITGICFNVKEVNEKFELEIVALDGFRVSTYTVPLEKYSKKEMLKAGTQFVIAKNDINKVLSILEKNVAVSYDSKNNRVCFLQGNQMLVVKCLEGVYPDYVGILKTSTATSSYVICDRDSLLKEINKCALADKTLITLKITEKEIKFYSKSQSWNIEGSVRVADASIEEEVEIDFNLKYLLEPISLLEDEEIQIDFKDSENPIICSTADFENVILPVARKK